MDVFDQNMLFLMNAKQRGQMFWRNRLRLSFWGLWHPKYRRNSITVLRSTQPLSALNLLTLFNRKLSQIVPRDPLREPHTAGSFQAPVFWFVSRSLACVCATEADVFVLLIETLHVYGRGDLLWRWQRVPLSFKALNIEAFMWHYSADLQTRLILTASVLLKNIIVSQCSFLPTYGSASVPQNSKIFN